MGVPLTEVRVPAGVRGQVSGGGLGALGAAQRDGMAVWQSAVGCRGLRWRCDAQLGWVVGQGGQPGFNQETGFVD